MTRWTCATMAALCSTLVSTAYADIWPGDQASAIAALSTRAISVQCAGVISGDEIKTLDAYIARERAAELAKPKTSHGIDIMELWDGLYADYERKYANPINCTADAREQARDMMDRVDLAVTGKAPLADPRVRIEDLIVTKAASDRCWGLFNVHERAALSSYLTQRRDEQKARETARHEMPMEPSYIQTEQLAHVILDGWFACSVSERARARKIFSEAMASRP
jgi:hypothetical protein